MYSAKVWIGRSRISCRKVASQLAIRAILPSDMKQIIHSRIVCLRKAGANMAIGPARDTLAWLPM